MNPLDDDRPCTIAELQDIITAPTGGCTLLPSTPYDLVLKNIYIGEGDSALRINCMKRLGVTHVLNAALGKDRYHVNSNHVMYRKADIEFLGIEATDFMNCDLAKHFDKAAHFIDSCLESGGTIYVHCVQGVSRSATLVLAYVMLKRHMPVQDALRMIRARREVCPNDGFLQQLCDLNEKLKKSGHFLKGPCESSQKHKDEIEGFSAATKMKKGDGENFSESKMRSQTNESHVVDCVETNVGHLHVDLKGEKSDLFCTVVELENILTAPSNGLMLLPRTSHSRINDHISIGDGTIAENLIGLKALGITHVLNTAHNKGVRIASKRYESAGIIYLGLEMEDTHRFDLSPYLSSAADFIHSSSDGHVLVNCVHGASRSASLVIAYFMIKHHMTVQSALHFVREKREICPNSFFLQQLCDLDKGLRNSRKEI